MNKRPYFSIVIATYNRKNDLEFALTRILAQSLKDFEVIVSDDCSTDGTKELLRQYKDSRIKYYRNKKNIGAILNIRSAMSNAKGKYVVFHGDDDYMLYDDILKNLKALFTKNKYGLIRLNYLYQTFDRKNVFDYFRNKSNQRNLTLPPHAAPRKIIKYIESIDLYFISGIIIRNPYPRKIEIIDSELMPWFKNCYDAIREYGALYIHSYNFIASWSNQKRNPVYYIENGKLPFEKLYEQMGKVVDKGIARKSLLSQLDISVNFFSIIKFNSDNDNLVKYAGRVLQLNRKYKTSFKFWIILSLSLLLPKFVLKMLRLIYIKRKSLLGKTQQYPQVMRRINQLRATL